MRTRNQAQIRRLKKMIDQGYTFTALAKRVGHPRSTVSKAVNHGRFPNVLRKVEEALSE
jgi:DNA invertase Pin-like site-specific DNA recombinase